MSEGQVNNYTFVNYPRQCTREEYESAIKRIVELHKDMEEVIALYRFGSISALGISDIDYFIVTKGEDMNFRYKCPHDKLTEKEKYLFQHYPSAILPRRLLQKLHLLAPFFEVECIYGRNKREEIVPKISKEEALLFLLDIIFMTYPRVIIEILESSVLDVQKALKIIHSLTYSIQLCQVINIKESRWQQYMHSVQVIRSSWFEEGKEKQHQEKLVFLLHEALSITMEMIIKINNFYERKGSVPESKDNTAPSLFMTRNQYVLFKNKYNSQDALKQMQDLYRKKRVFILILPVSFAEQLKSYTLTNTLFGNYIKRYFKKYLLNLRENKEELFINNTKKERAIAMSELLEYSLKINYKWGAFTPFNLGYLNHQGYPNRIRDTLWNIFYAAKIKKLLEL